MDKKTSQGGWKNHPAPFFALQALRQDPVIKAAHEMGEGKIFLVGGVLRNLLLGEDLPPDYDFVMAGDVEKISQSMAEKLGGKAFLLDKKARAFRIALKGGDVSVDFSPIKGGSIEEDLKTRDFTVNATGVVVSDIFRRETPALFDPTGGIRDAGKRLLRMTSEEVFDEDPLRCIRAVRISQRHGLKITGDTGEAVRERAGLLKLKKTSAERIRDELSLIFECPGTPSSVKTLYELDIIETILPEVSGWEDAGGYPLLDHSLKTLDEAEKLLETISRRGFPVFNENLIKHFNSKVGKTTRAAIFKLASFLHDAGKPGTAKREEGVLTFMGHDLEGKRLASEILTRLRFSRRVAAIVSNLVRNHHRVFTLAALEKPTARARAHLFRAAEKEVTPRDEPGVDLLLLALSDARATRGGEDPALFEVVVEMLRFYYGVYSKKRPMPLLAGEEIMETFGVQEGRIVGEIMDRVSEGVEKGLVRNKREAKKYAAEWLKKR